MWNNTIPRNWNKDNVGNVTMVTNDHCVLNLHLKSEINIIVQYTMRSNFFQVFDWMKYNSSFGLTCKKDI